MNPIGVNGTTFTVAVRGCTGRGSSSLAGTDASSATFSG